MAPNVAIVYGSFFMGDSERDAEVIQSAFPQIKGLDVGEPVEGNDFDFNSLKDCKFLIIVTSSQYGMPPAGFKEFAHQLLLAAETNPGCLSHLQHTVYGNGDETYFKTYMNMPRYMDKLLEKCGSNRFFARGETGEPHAPMDTEKCACPEWAPMMWQAAEAAMEKPPKVAWDALWAKSPPQHHTDITEWSLKKLETKLGKLKKAPSVFSKL
jgi:sulfite reductase alpha subunit-like flavoprotein